MHPTTSDQIVAVVLLDIAVIVLAARVMGILARRLGQPTVVGEIVAGLVLGPSLLGLLPGNPSVALFPFVVRPYLNVVAQIGLVIFMFIIGLELDLGLVRGRERFVSVTSISSISLPFGLGLALATFIYHEHREVAGKLVAFWPFALFLGVSMSITAFPVLARMLTERGMQRIDIGAIALACAAVDDVMAWSILAVVVAVANATSAVQVPRTIGEAVAFVLVMFFVVKPLLRQVGVAYQRTGRLTPNILAVLIAGFLGSAFVTGWIGLHVIFGPFLFGVIVTREHTAAMFQEVLERLEQVSLLLLLPVFFVVTGLGANITKLGPHGLLVLVAVLFVAITGKFVGATGAARLQGLSTRKSRAIGTLMNSRGLTQLVVLNVGVSLKVLDQSLFTILVLMAVITTVMTGPLLKLVYPPHVLEREINEAERASMGLVDGYRVVVTIDEPSRSRGLIDVGAALVADDGSAELVLSRFIENSELELASGLSLDLVQVAAGLAEMQTLSQPIAANGVAVVVRSQATDDLVQAVVSQVDAIEADVLLVPVDLRSRTSQTAPAERLEKEASTTVALFSDPHSSGVDRGQTVAVRPGPGFDGDVALELAIRLADGIGGTLQLLAPNERRQLRRVEEIAQALAGTGIVVEVDDGSPVPRSRPASGAQVLTVVSVTSLGTPTGGLGAAARELSEDTNGAVLLIRAGKSESDDGLTRLLARLHERGTASNESSDNPGIDRRLDGGERPPVLSP